MKNKQGKLSNAHQNALVFAARYAHTRPTGASLQVVMAIEELWDSLDEMVKVDLKREAISDATCNFEDWERLKNLKLKLDQ